MIKFLLAFLKILWEIIFEKSSSQCFKKQKCPQNNLCCKLLLYLSFYLEQGTPRNHLQPNNVGGFPGGPGLNALSVLSLPRETVQSLGRELRSHMPRGVAKKKKNPARGCASPYPTFSREGRLVPAWVLWQCVRQGQWRWALWGWPSRQPTPAEARKGQRAQQQAPCGSRGPRLLPFCLSDPASQTRAVRPGPCPNTVWGFSFLKAYLHFSGASQAH